MRTPWRALALLPVLVLLVDVRGLPGTFVADDIPIVAGDPRVASFDVRAIFTTDYWGRGTNSGLYRPLTLLSFALERRLFGAGAAPHRATNMLLHAGTAVLLALLVLALGFPLPLAWTAGALFAVHPIHADVVHILVGRAEILVALLLLLALFLARTRGPRAWPLVAACYGAALLCKEHAVTFLPLLALTDLFAARGSAVRWRERGLLYAILLGVTGAWLLARRAVFSDAGVGALLIYPVDNPLAGAAVPTRLLTAVKVNLDYVLSLMLPTRLQSVYSGPGLRPVASIFSAWGLAALAYVSALAALGFHGWRRRLGHGYGIPFFLLAFAVTANVFFVTTVLRADRFAYLPAAGFCLGLAQLLLVPERAAVAARRPWLGRLPATAVLLAFAGLGVGRAALFRDPERLWSSAVRVDPGNARAWSLLGQARWREGRLEAAEEALRAGIRSAPEFPDAHAAFSGFLLERGRPAEAAAAAREAIRLAPGAVGLAQLVLAEALLALDRPGEALGALEEARPMFEGSARWWLALARAQARLGNQGAAAAAYGRVLAIDPNAAP